MADPKQNRKGYVVLKHKETGAVQEFLPESVEVWKDAGWAEASENDVKKAVEDGTEPISTSKPAKKEN